MLGFIASLFRVDGGNADKKKPISTHTSSSSTFGLIKAGLNRSRVNKVHVASCGTLYIDPVEYLHSDQVINDFKRAKKIVEAQ